MKGSPCNGWIHWYFLSKDKKMYAIDELREKYRKDFLNQEERT